MTIDAPCPNCSTLFTVRRELIGKRTKCTRCGAPVTITEPPAAPAPPAVVSPVTTPPQLQQPVFPDIPLHPPYQTHATSAPAGQPTASRPNTGGFLGVATESSRPRFPAIRMVAKIFQVMAFIDLALAAIFLVVTLVFIIQEPSAVFRTLNTFGAQFFVLLVSSLIFFFVAQAIQLGLKIEQNTRETSDSCRRLADHLTAIEIEH